MNEPTNFPAVNGYCQIIDVWRKFGPTGFRWAVDRAGDGTADMSQVQSFTVSGITYASNLIDEYICGKIRPEVARALSNKWLLDRCADIAAYETCRIGGREIPETMVDARNDAIQRLERVQDGGEIPSLTIPPALGARWGGSNRPRVVNIFEGRRGRRCR